MTKRILIFILALSTLLLCACTEKPAGDTQSTPPPSQSASPPDTASPPPSPAPSQETPSLPAAPAVRVSTELENSCTVIAGRDINALYNMSSPYVYLYADEPVYDLLISQVLTDSEDTSEPAEIIYADVSLYAAELLPGQTILMPDPYSYEIDNDVYCTRIAYTNSAGEYEAVQLFGEADNNNPSIDFIDPNLSDEIYCANYYTGEYDLDMFSEDFRAKMLNGDFDDYVPKGLCIMSGTLGDVNSDGTQDALIGLTSAMVFEQMYSSVVPLFVLIGQPNGGYVVECKVADALFSPYRSESYPIAGDGYIDIVYSYVGGAASHHTQIFHFPYNKAENDWLLEEFSYQPTFRGDYEEELPPEPVRPFPEFAGMPLEKLTGEEFFNGSLDIEYVDETCQFFVPSYDDKYKDIYTLIVVLNESTGYYEGYIYQYYEAMESGNFIQTIRGDYSPDIGFALEANEEEKSFAVCGDVWTMSEYDPLSFHLTK